MAEPLLSVVICTYNRSDALRISLETAVDQEIAQGTFEIVVVDDGSTDATRATVEAIAARGKATVRYVRQEGRGGIAQARNRGVHEAKGAYVVFFDDDQLADPGWLERLMTVVRKNNALCAGGPRRLDLPAAQLARLGPVCRGILGEHIFADEPAILRGKDLPSTGNLLVAKQVFDTVGLFDPSLSSGEDAEFLGRARRAGIDIWTAPGAMVAHMIPPYRAEAPYFRWVSLRWGANFAQMDAKTHGKGRMLLNSMLRLIQAAMIMPKLAWSLCRDDLASAIDLQCRLWRAWGYTRRTAQLAAPRLFPQQRFFEMLDFRNERRLFALPPQPSHDSHQAS